MADKTSVKVAFYDIETANDPGDVGWHNYQLINFACGGLVSVEFTQEDQVDPDIMPSGLTLLPWSSCVARVTRVRVYRNPRTYAEELSEHDLVVGFNNHHFDDNVILAHSGGDQVFQFKGFDILADLTLRTGIKFVTNLNNLALCTLETGKSSDVSGKDAPALWKSGQKSKVEAYCLQDCWVTFKVFEFGVRHGYVLAPPNSNPDLFGNLSLKIPVSWNDRIFPAPAVTAKSEGSD